MITASTRTIRRLLIANRGEIAVRLIRACRARDISPVAVASDADLGAPHVAMADQVVVLGPGPAAQSYLCGDKIVAAALRSGADAIHPGYGFLSERAEFARMVEDAGLVWIGPPSSAIELLGDKIAAKKRVAASGVPVVPGYYDEDQSDQRLAREAEQIGAPLLIKAAAGGGGRGQRVVRHLAQFDSALVEARRESQASFGDERVLLERFIERPRHIEFQIFCDRHGNAVSLFERECSVQRRQQKIIEESPSAAMTAELRARMGDAAVAAGLAAGYVNAGTVEFLLDTSDPARPVFYFLEVNTRLQVEHPVTELITGLDLVGLQIAIAEGCDLTDIAPPAMRGHATELRIYAEDPEAGFLPSIGTIAQWSAPEGPGVRLDSGVQAGSAVTPFYDPMLAKLIVYGQDRAESIARALAALREFQVLGVRTNIEYLQAILAHPEYAAGNLTIRFLDEHFAGWKPGDEIPAEAIAAATAISMLKAKTPQAMPENASANPWLSTTTWRNA